MTKDELVTFLVSFRRIKLYSYCMTLFLLDSINVGRTSSKRKKAAHYKCRCSDQLESNKRKNALMG